MSLELIQRDHQSSAAFDSCAILDALLGSYARPAKSFATRGLFCVASSFRLARENKEETYYFFMRDREGNRKRMLLEKDGQTDRVRHFLRSFDGGCRTFFFKYCPLFLQGLD